MAAGWEDAHFDDCKEHCLGTALSKALLATDEMQQLLKHKGHMIVNSGRHRGARYDELDAEAWQKYSKRAPGEPELQKFCRTAISLAELDELCANSNAPRSNQGGNELAVVPYVAKKKAETAQSSVKKEQGISLHGWTRRANRCGGGGGT